MRAWLGIALAFAVLGSGLQTGRALAEPAVSPDLDCKLGFEALRNWAAWLPDAVRTNPDGRDVFTITEPEVWRVEIAFSVPGRAAHPAVVLRKFVKQVTGVWTVQSKVCGYGNQVDFLALVDEMKAEDSRLTNLSRAEAERLKREQSPLGSTP